MEMDPLLHLRYLTWATVSILDAAKQLPPAEFDKDRGSSYGGIKGTLEHIFRADNVWFSRVAGEPFANIADVPVPATFPELEREWMALLDRFQKWFQQLEANRYSTEVRYSNSQGVPFS